MVVLERLERVTGDDEKDAVASSAVDRGQPGDCGRRRARRLCRRDGGSQDAENARRRPTPDGALKNARRIRFRGGNPRRGPGWILQARAMGLGEWRLARARTHRIVWKRPGRAQLGRIVEKTSKEREKWGHVRRAVRVRRREIVVHVQRHECRSRRRV